MAAVVGISEWYEMIQLERGGKLGRLERIFRKYCGESRLPRFES